MSNYQYDHEGLVLTEDSEALRLIAYPDVKSVITIGYGHTGSDVHPGMTITPAEAEILLKSDVAAAAHCVNLAVTSQISQHQFDALVDFTFNVGRGNFLKSTLLRDVNAGNFAGAASQFAAWDESGGRVFAGLVRRRSRERAMFLEA